MSRRRLHIGDTAQVTDRGLIGMSLTDGHPVIIPRGATGRIVGHWADHHVSVSPTLPPMLCLRITVGSDQADVPVDSDMAGAVTPISARRRWRGWRAVSAGAMVTATIWTTALTVWATSGEDHLHVDHNIMHTVEVDQ